MKMISTDGASLAFGFERLSEHGRIRFDRQVPTDSAKQSRPRSLNPGSLLFCLFCSARDTHGVPHGRVGGVEKGEPSIWELGNWGVWGTFGHLESEPIQSGEMQF